ncbi:hypothetical protein Lser_V15G07916 [Lactuca serriola]
MANTMCIGIDGNSFNAKDDRSCRELEPKSPANPSMSATHNVFPSHIPNSNSLIHRPTHT